MSGFEVAGLVLAAVPLIVEALKAYNESKNFYDRFRNKRVLISDLMLNLEYYRWSITEQVAKVLDGAGVDVTETELRSGAAARKFQDPSRNETVSAYLGLERFNQFVRQLVICQRVMREIVGKFEGLLTSGNVPSTTDVDDGELLQRLLFAGSLSDSSTRWWEKSGSRLKFSYKNRI